MWHSVKISVDQCWSEKEGWIFTVENDAMPLDLVQQPDFKIIFGNPPIGDCGFHHVFRDFCRRI